MGDRKTAPCMETTMPTDALLRSEPRARTYRRYGRVVAIENNVQHIRCDNGEMVQLVDDEQLLFATEGSIVQFDFLVRASVVRR